MNDANAWAHAAMALAALAGFSCLALAMERHQNDLCSRSLSVAVSRVLRGMGWGLLLLCLVVAVRCKGWGFGLALFSGHTSMAAGVVLVAMLLINRLQERARRP